MNKEVILSRIADVLGRDGFILKNNGEFQARYKCVELGEYYKKVSEYLTPYYYNQWNGRKYPNDNAEYNVFLGLDSTFEELYKENKNEEIISFLKELTKSFNIYWILEHLQSDFDELVNLYKLFGLNIEIDNERIKVSTLMGTNNDRISEIFSVESWLFNNHPEVYEAYDSAISNYIDGHPGTCIEACRTTIVSIFSKYRGTEKFAKWLRGIFNLSGDSTDSTVEELTSAIGSSLKKDELAEFFHENKYGKLTKTKTIYMIYSMMSDYGTHRNEATKEVPTMSDALFMLRLTDSILFWVYSNN